MTETDKNETDNVQPAISFHINNQEPEAHLEPISLTVRSKTSPKVNTVEEISETDKPWNNRIKLLLKKLGEKSMGYRWMHDQENEHNLQMDNALNISEIVLGAILTTLQSSNLITIYNDSEIKDAIIFAITLISLVLTIILTIVIAISKKIKYKKTASMHKESATKFIQIYHSIQEQLSLKVTDREPDKLFLKKKIKEYDDLMQSMPNIRKSTLDLYVRATKNNHIYKPVISDELEKIEIHEGESVGINIKDDSKQDKSQSKINYEINYEINRWIHNF